MSKMEDYHKFNRKVLAFIGIELETSQSFLPFNLMRSATTFLFLLLAIVQNIMLLSTFDKISVKVNDAIAILLCGVMGLLKLAAVVRNQKQLTDIKAKLSQLMNEFEKKKFDTVIKDLKFYELLAKVLFRVTVFCSLLFSLTPVIVYIVNLIAKGQATLILPYSMWYPFKEENYLFLIYVYEAISASVWSLVPQAVNGLVVLMIAQLAVLFDSFGENLCADINKASKEMSIEINCSVEYHVEILKIGEVLVRIFEVPLLVNVLGQTGLLCFIAFNITVSSLSQLR